MVRRSDLLWDSAVSLGEGMDSDGSSGLGGDVDPGLGSLPESDLPELEPGEWDETSETPSEPRLSCLLSGAR